MKNIQSQHDADDDADANADADVSPGLAIRRHHDRCFHSVEEVVPGGYIVEGIFIDEDDVADVRKEDDSQNTCGKG